MNDLQARIELAHKRWTLAQELNLWTYPEQDADASLLEWALGRLPE